MASARRLRCIQHALALSSQVIGTLTLGDISFLVLASATPSRLPHTTPLDPNDPCTCVHLYVLQKFVLGRGVFLITQPGSYAEARAHVLQVQAYFSLPPIGCGVGGKAAWYECIALHRDVGETELKQAREIREGGNLVQCRGACCQDEAYPYHERASRRLSAGSCRCVLVFRFSLSIYYIHRNLDDGNTHPPPPTYAVPSRRRS
jgi:hypothetical protein